MIIAPLIYKTIPNRKKWKRGFINLPKSVTDALGDEERELVVIMIGLKEKPNVEEMQKKLDEFYRYVDLEKDLEKLKASMGGMSDDSVDKAQVSKIPT